MFKKRIISLLMAGIFVLSSGYSLIYASTFEDNEYKQEFVDENEMIVDKKGNRIGSLDSEGRVVGK